ncbi:hypothetical protein D3C72_2098150 [compost metagenome]
MQHVLDRRIEATGNQVVVNLILVLIGLSFDTSLVQNGFGIGFLDTSLQIAYGLALKGSNLFAQTRVFLEHIRGCAGEQLI